ncbi:hypothetical protein [Olivibacter domesticus]|uniref:TerB family tellurite resistance protein n=1 Tax=Olivibacter domesticus TaxID=407022 RepID=A0A1H7I8Q2_OLID1|nr:hypothetical protein [Olivibacter domesticus]SEK58889.1 hypothetical protein SAMN05661044_00621 [Olivibacter domesticus]
MKKGVLVVVMVLSLNLYSYGQANEIAQLLLNVEKLSQFNQILKDLKTSYKILSTGYTAIKDISEGNFTLHKQFLDGLMAVSPTVKKYRKIGWIVEDQLRMVQEYKKANKVFRANGNFNAEELGYVSGVYENLLKLSLGNLDELILVTTAGKLRMSDDERLKAIDRIYLDMQDKLHFLWDFNSSTALLAMQRQKERVGIDVMQQMHDVVE